jgi:hypothetical protein
MIEFVLYVYLGSTLIDNTQKFKDIDRCLYFAERLVPTEVDSSRRW